jgi:hypothetical protein
MRKKNLDYAQFVLVQAKLNFSNKIICNLKNTDEESKSSVAYYFLILINSTRSNCNRMETFINVKLFLQFRMQDQIFFRERTK